MYILGYIPKDNKLYLSDKDMNVVGYSLLLSVLEYQTAVMRQDFETAKQVMTSLCCYFVWDAPWGIIWPCQKVLLTPWCWPQVIFQLGFEKRVVIIFALLLLYWNSMLFFCHSVISRAKTKAIWSRAVSPLFEHVLQVISLKTDWSILPAIFHNHWF